MRAVLKIADVLEFIPNRLGKIFAWLILLLIAVIMYDVVTRKLGFIQVYVQENEFLFNFLAPIRLQELEWHLHAIIFFMALGFTYTVNAHVRVDLIREKLADKRQAWIEFLGIIFFMLPYVLVALYVSFQFFHSAWIHDEGSISGNGLPRRWIVKSFLISGLALALCAGLSTLLRHFVYLFGPLELKSSVKMDKLTSATADFLPQIDESEITGEADTADASAVAPNSGH